jgi:hypothetical protein
MPANKNSAALKAGTDKKTPAPKANSRAQAASSQQSSKAPAAGECEYLNEDLSQADDPIAISLQSRAKFGSTKDAVLSAKDVIPKKIQVVKLPALKVTGVTAIIDLTGA